MSIKANHIATTFLVLFFVSVMFPIVASITNLKGEVKTEGYFDVAVAIICFILFISLTMKVGKVKEDAVLAKAQKIFGYLAGIPLALIAIFFLGVTLNWMILLIGLGWRFWLIVSALPYLIKALQTDARG